MLDLCRLWSSLGTTLITRRLTARVRCTHRPGSADRGRPDSKPAERWPTSPQRWVCRVRPRTKWWAGWQPEGLRPTAGCFPAGLDVSHRASPRRTETIESADSSAVRIELDIPIRADLDEGVTTRKRRCRGCPQPIVLAHALDGVLFERGESTWWRMNRSTASRCDGCTRPAAAS